MAPPTSCSPRCRRASSLSRQQPSRRRGQIPRSRRRAPNRPLRRGVLICKREGLICRRRRLSCRGGGHWVGQGGGRRADHLLRQGGGYPLRPAIIAFAGSTREALGSAVLSGVCVIALGSGRTSRYGWAPGVLALLCLTPPHRRLLASRLGYMASLATLRLACGGAPHRVFGSLTLAWSSARLLLSYRRTAAAVAAGAARRETCARAAAGSGGVVCASGGQPSTRAGRGGGSFSARMMSVEGHRCLHFLLGYDDGRFVFDTSQRQRATT